MPRKYELKQRAESLSETRARIVSATVELHDSLGPAQTTITAIAERAGVQRLTVYRHFPDERSLFEACSLHWASENPAPDQATWAAIEDPDERLRVALGEIYAFFGRTQGMTGNLLRDLPGSPVLQEVAAPYLAYWQGVRDVLAHGWTTRGRKRRLLKAVIAHAIEFDTWRSLTQREGLDDIEAANVMVRLAQVVRLD
jgi:AcrR family transcriptional regulator